MAQVVVVHPDLNFGGGAEVVCARTVEVLSGAHDVTLVTWTEPDRERLDALFGTDLSGARFKVMSASGHVRAPSTVRNRLLFQHVVGARLVRSLFRDHDLVVGTHGELATPQPTIQYVHHPVFSSRVPQEILAGTPAYLPERVLRRGARAVARALTGGSRAAYARNLTIANSAYTAEWIRRAWGIVAKVLWPPVPMARTTKTPWDQREAGVVCVGKLRPGKRILEIIHAVEAARRLGAEIHVHVVGDGGGPYSEAVREACRRSECATYEGTLTLPDLTALLASHRFGAHGFPHEHFGISLAQMVRAGCICFAPHGGAPMQLMAATPYLLYRNFDELAARLAATARDGALQAQLRIDLGPLRQALDRHRFGEEMASLVEDRLAADRGLAQAQPG